MVEMESPLKILQVSTADRLAGAESSAWNLFEAYRQKGHQSWLAVGYKFLQNPDVFEIPNDIYRTRWARICLGLSSPLWNERTKIRGIFHLRKILRSIGEPQSWLESQRGFEDFNFPGTSHLLNLTPERPDILHCHNLHGGYFDLRVLPLLSHQVPVILNLRDAWLLSGHCAHSFDCDRWKIGCGQCPDLTIPPAIQKDATSYNWQRKQDIYKKSRLYITTPSKWLMDKVQSSMLKGVQNRVIPNAIDLTVFNPGSQTEARQALGLPVNAKIVLLIAHSIFKDYETMEAALSKLEKTDDAELIFICLSKRKGVSKLIGQGKMIYRGLERNPHNMALYYRAANVYILSAKAEAFGKTVAEALACGVPVVATSVGGIPEQIQHGKTGFLVPPKDSYSMSESIKKLLKNSESLFAMKELAATYARLNFGLERQVNDFLNWYEEIIEDWKVHKSESSSLN